MKERPKQKSWAGWRLAADNLLPHQSHFIEAPAKDEIGRGVGIEPDPARSVARSTLTLGPRQGERLVGAQPPGTLLTCKI